MPCFLIGATGDGLTRRKDALLGSVSDDPYDVRTFLRLVRPKEALAHIGTELVSTSEHTLLQRGYFARPGETTRGINEAGLAFTCALVIEDESAKKDPSASLFADVTNEMMRSCTNVDEAIELFRSKKATNPAYSVLLADARGHLAHLEVGNHGLALNDRRSPDHPGAVFAVNCYLAEALKSYNAPQTFLSNEKNNNKARRNRGEELAKTFRDKLDVDTLAQLLSDHHNGERDPVENPVLAGWGYSICNHGTRKQETPSSEDLPWGTVSAEIMEPSQKKFWYAYGWPCGQKPEYGDQLYQEHSWGRFIPFDFDQPGHDEVKKLTTPEGKILA